MTNYEKFKDMSVEDMADFFYAVKCIATIVHF